MSIATLRDIVIDCADPVPLAGFWSQVLGYPILFQADDGGTVCLDAPDDPMRLWLVRVPEPKTVKNRVHIDARRGLGGPGGSRRQRVLRVPASGGDERLTRTRPRHEEVAAAADDYPSEAGVISRKPGIRSPAAPVKG